MSSIFFYLMLTVHALQLPTHGFHLSHTLIEYKAAEATLQISISLTLDDLEKTLEDGGAPRLHLCTQQEHEEGSAYIFQYLQQQLQIELNGMPVSYDWIGKEISEDLEGVWIYLEVANVASLKEIQITNKILLDSLDDQKNIVQIKGTNDQQGYFLLRKGHVREKVVF